MLAMSYLIRILVSSFDEYIFCQTWLPVYCSQHPCGGHNGAFSIHGLWPTWKNGSWPEYCPPLDNLTVEEIAHILPDMQTHWSDKTNGSDTMFWNHEWQRHGTCSGLTPLVYFSTGIWLASQQDMTKRLLETPIQSDGSYKKQDLVDRLRIATPHCITLGSKSYLAEIRSSIRLPITLNETVPAPDDGTCGDRIYARISAIPGGTDVADCAW